MILVIGLIFFLFHTYIFDQKLPNVKKNNLTLFEPPAYVQCTSLRIFDYDQELLYIYLTMIKHFSTYIYLSMIKLPFIICDAAFGIRSVKIFPRLISKHYGHNFISLTIYFTLALITCRNSEH